VIEVGCVEVVALVTLGHGGGEPLGTQLWPCGVSTVPAHHSKSRGPAWTAAETVRRHLCRAQKRWST